MEVLFLLLGFVVGAVASYLTHDLITAKVSGVGASIRARLEKLIRP